MKPQKSMSIVLFSILFFLLIGCDNRNMQVLKNSETNKTVEVTINSEINKYSPAMSSTPGIPLVAGFTSSIKPEDIKYHWVTEQGTFLDWRQDSGKTNILGKDVKINERKIYWSVDPNEEIKKSPFKIYLKIENNDASKVIYETRIEVEKSKDGFFQIKK